MADLIERKPLYERAARLEAEALDEASKLIAELDKLEEYLKKNNIPYKRVDEGMRRHQILVPEEYPNVEWDAICQLGSYGYEDGLLEIMGVLVDEKKDGDIVVGYLTAEDVVKRIEERRK